MINTAEDHPQQQQLAQQALQVLSQAHLPQRRWQLPPQMQHPWLMEEHLQQVMGLPCLHLLYSHLQPRPGQTLS